MSRFGKSRTSRYFKDIQEKKVIDLSQGVPISDQAKDMVQVRLYTYHFYFRAFKVIDTDVLDENGKPKKQMVAAEDDMYYESTSPLNSVELREDARKRIMEAGQFSRVVFTSEPGLVTATMKMVKKEELEQEVTQEEAQTEPEPSTEEPQL